MQQLRRPLPPTARSVVFRGHLDRADDAGVQRGEVLGRDPVSEDGLAAGLVDLILVRERSQDLEAGDVSAPECLTFQSRAILAAYSWLSTR